MYSPKEIWTILEIECKSNDNFLALKYCEFIVIGDKPIMDQVHELQIVASKLSELQIKIPNLFQVEAILSKLVPS